MTTLGFVGLLLFFAIFVLTGVWWVMLKAPTEPSRPEKKDLNNYSNDVLNQYNMVRSYLEELEATMAHSGKLGEKEKLFFTNRRELLSKMELRLVSFSSNEGDKQSQLILEELLEDLEKIQTKFISGSK